MERTTACVFLVMMLLASQVSGWEEPTATSTQANPLGSETFCTLCRSTMRIVGTEFIYVGSQILTASESLLMFCRRIVIPGADLCGSIISRTGGILGYSAQTAGEALVVFCGLNPLCSLSDSVSSEQLVVTYPDAFVCVDCMVRQTPSKLVTISKLKDQVKQKFHKDEIKGSLHAGAAIEKFCALSPRWGAKNIVDYFTCQRKIQKAILKERDDNRAGMVTLRTKNLCYQAGYCSKVVMDYLDEHPIHK